VFPVSGSKFVFRFTFEVRGSRFGVPGFRGSGVPGFRGSGVPGFRGSGFRGFRNAEHELGT